MLVKVTQNDIDKGYKGECRACPIYLAAVRAGLPDDIVVVNEYIKLWNRILLPKIAQDFINKFDNGEKVDPIEFEIEDFKIKNLKYENQSIKKTH